MTIEGLESEKIFITQALITDAEAGSLTNEPRVTLGYFGATVDPPTQVNARFEGGENRTLLLCHH